MKQILAFFKVCLDDIGTRRIKLGYYHSYEKIKILFATQQNIGNRQDWMYTYHAGSQQRRTTYVYSYLCTHIRKPSDSSPTADSCCYYTYTNPVGTFDTLYVLTSQFCASQSKLQYVRPQYCLIYIFYTKSTEIYMYGKSSVFLLPQQL